MRPAPSGRVRVFTAMRALYAPWRPELAVRSCWQFQADMGASQRNHPDLGHTDVLRALRRVGSKVLGGLARQ